MQWSSESIASLAAALAKAQTELINPEKSLVATIRSDGPRGTEKTFRYAPLSSGLDIVRKTLGQHDIATVQTTSTDQATGIINVTTVLAHASGEWIASDWPVCSVNEIATPRRMGEALTYARRYSLFALVGIAGEDDLDAPDLTTPANRANGPEKPKPNGSAHLNGGQSDPVQPAAPSGQERVHSRSAKAILGAEASAELRDRLIAELNDLGSSENAAIWAHRCLREKNSLTEIDAVEVEKAFAVKLTALASNPAAPGETLEPQPNGSLTQISKPNTRTRSKVIDKSVLTIPEPRRVRDREHVKSVAEHPCLICGRQPADAHHLRFVQSRALGRKVSDEFTVPLCRGHHREVHRCGDEAAWWTRNGIDPTVAARALWIDTHPLAIDQGGNSTDIADLPTKSCRRDGESEAEIKAAN